MKSKTSYYNTYSNYNGRLGNSLKKRITELNTVGAKRDKTGLINLLQECRTDGLLIESEELVQKLIKEAETNFQKAYLHTYNIYLKGDALGVL